MGGFWKWWAGGKSDDQKAEIRRQKVIDRQNAAQAETDSKTLGKRSGPIKRLFH
jgi:hypothetical protein